MKLLIIITLLFSLKVIYSQNTFSKTYYSSEDSRSFRVKEDLAGNFIVSGSKTMNSNLFKPFVYKIDNKGNIVDSALYFNDLPYDMYIQDVLPVNSKYIFIGFTAKFSSYASSPPSDSLMFYIRTDTNLNIIDTAFYCITFNEYIRYSTSKIDLYGNIIVAGHYSNAGRYGSFIYKLSADGDSLASFFLPVDSLRRFNNIMIDSDFYYILSKAYGQKHRLLYKYDTNLVVQATYNIPFVVDYQYSPVLINDSTYYTSGIMRESDKMNFSIAKLTMKGKVLDSLVFGSNTVENYSGFYDALCMQNGSFYYVGNIYENLSLLPYGNNHPSEIYLAKIDTNFNFIWEKHIGGDAFYTVTNVIATSDGSALLLATRNDITDNLNQLDIYLVKVDSNGNTTWVQNIKQSAIELSLYPNPTTSQLNITLKSPHKSIRQLKITDLQGKKILQKQINAKQTKLDVSNLSKGVYILEGLTNTGESFSRKFVKE